MEDRVLRDISNEVRDRTKEVKGDDGVSNRDLEAAIVRPRRLPSHTEEGESYLASEEYVDDILCVLKRNESVYCVREDYLLNVQNDITETMRSILIDWLVEVSVHSKLNQETVHLSINYLDRFLELQPVNRSQLQLLGASCLFLAAKFEEMYPPKIDVFVYMSDYTYTHDQIVHMESIVLNCLEFRLTIATILPFLNSLLFCEPRSGRIESLCAFLADLSLLSYPLVRSLPSVVAAACVYVARRAVGEKGWTPHLAERSGFDANNLRTPAKEILALWRRSISPSFQLRAIGDKYTTRQYETLTNIYPPAVL